MGTAAPTAPAGGEAPAEASDAQLMIVAQEMGLWCEAYTAPRESGVATELDITPEDAAEFNAASLKDIRAALKAAGLYTHPSADLRGAAEQALEALKDMNNGWKYIRSSHGDLYGVGWDRAQDKADAAIASLEAAISRKGKTEHRLDSVPVVAAFNPSLDQGPCTVCGKLWRDHGTSPVYEDHNYTPISTALVSRRGKTE